MTKQKGNAGVTSQQLSPESARAMKVVKESMRGYDQKSEDDRKILYSNIQVKDHYYYNKRDSLWNEPHRLHPKKFAIYSEKNIDPSTTFKKTIFDLPKIKEHESQQDFNNKFQKIMRLKREDAERNAIRKLERQVW